MLNILGLIASIISFVLFLPQAKLTYKNRNNPQKLSTLSIGTQLLIMANATIWGIYAFLTNAFWVGAPGLVNFPLAFFTIVLILKNRKGETSKNWDRFCKSCGFEGDHLIFVTQPPGFGSIIYCSEENSKLGVPFSDYNDVKDLRNSIKN